MVLDVISTVCVAGISFILGLKSWWLVEKKIVDPGRITFTTAQSSFL
jgi:hypothetical protein